MAVQKFSSNWNGVTHTSNNCKIETCYSVYADMSSASNNSYIQVNGFSIYADTQANLTSFIASSSVRFKITRSGSSTATTLGTYSIPQTVHTGAYSPAGNWMQYYVTVSSSDQFVIPNDGSLFTLTVSIIASSTEKYSFTEQCHGIRRCTITAPTSMVTGRVYTFTSSSALKATTGYKTSTSLTWRPKVDDVYANPVFDSGYSSSSLRTDQATSDFTTFYFAVPNPEHLSSAGASTTENATIVVQTKYTSAAFTGGITITEVTLSIPVSPRVEVDSDLKPTLTSALITKTATPAAAVISGKYVHNQTTVTYTPNPQFKYGDSLSYIQFSGSNRYAGSVSFVATGVIPGTTYVRPDTGASVTAGEESVRAQTVAVVGSKWGLSSDIIQVVYNVLFYHMPRLAEFSVHRASVSSTATDYRYNNTYYKKDDFGAYCLTIIKTDFSSLNNTNDISMTVQHGTSRMSVTPTNGVTQIVVVSANTAQTLDVTVILYDLFYSYGVSSQLRLSTANVLIDWLAGGKGMAVGKNASTQNALDIASNWKLLFYQATVGAYSGTSSINLVSWMHDVDNRLSALEGSS